MNALWLALLLSSVIWAEEEYFHISLNVTLDERQYFLQSSATWNETKLCQQNTTWDKARHHCQACFKELTTITSRNVHLIVQQNVSLDYWIGLRKSFNGTIPWSRWSNDDPVTYQNWYPGHPVPNKVKKMIPKCYSTTQIPQSTLITTTSTPVTSSQTSKQSSSPTSTVTSPVTSPENSTTSQTNKTDYMCPILFDILKCLNVTYNELESKVHQYTYATPQIVTPKTTTYSTATNATTYSTTPNTTTFSTTPNATTNATTTESTTTSNCIFEPEPDPEVYIENACVVLLSFGMWKEINCNESLPFICYDDRFVGQINVSDVTTRAGNLSWSNPPGNITHYRVEITGNQTKQTSNETVLYKQIQALTPGNLYRVQVFPVKCGRDLNPQNISFYTKPAGVENLTVVSVTTVSISLSWSKPEGDCDFYSVLVRNVLDNSKMIKDCDREECTITGLTPGNEYNFIVTAIVNKTTEGVPSSVSKFTIPSKVLELKSSDNDSSVIRASWKAPFGRHSGYRYCLKQVDNSETCTDCNITTNCITENCNNATDSNIATNCNFTTNEFMEEENKTDGAKYCLCVTALANGTIPGEMVVIPAFTNPKTVTLFLTSDSQTMTASWTIYGKYENFNVMIKTDDKILQNTTTANLNYTFTGLKAGVQYSVTVITLNGILKSYPAYSLAYTYPTKPGPAKATSNKTTIYLTWGVPEESKDARILYKVEYHAAFWGDRNEMHTNYTELTFPNLRPGTRYEFNVSVVAGNLTSLPVHARADTEPEKRTLILTIACSSEKPLHCEQEQTKTMLFNKLNMTFKEKLHEDVHWKLKWVDRKELKP